VFIRSAGIRRTRERDAVENYSFVAVESEVVTFFELQLTGIVACGGVPAAVQPLREERL
jgi:hypothetical protein